MNDELNFYAKEQKVIYQPYECLNQVNPITQQMFFAEIIVGVASVFGWKSNTTSQLEVRSEISEEIGGAQVLLFSLILQH